MKDTTFELCFTIRLSSHDVRIPVRGLTVGQAKEQADNYIASNQKAFGLHKTVSYGVGIETRTGWQCQAWRAVHPVTGVASDWVNW